ncbi:Flagellar basal body rod protein FlgB [Vibrio chagasii]|nr:Flagellar basal body rod protein FlgB [Vibrio chagasii]
MSGIDSINFLNAAMQVREAQLSVTAGNLANQDTPNFKAKGIDFKTALAAKTNNDKVGLQVSDPRHMQAADVNNGFDVQYVNSGITRADGNTVNSHLEKGKFAEYELQYQMALTLSQNKTSSLTGVIKDAR